MQFVVDIELRELLRGPVKANTLNVAMKEHGLKGLAVFASH